MRNNGFTLAIHIEMSEAKPFEITYEFLHFIRPLDVLVLYDHNHNIGIYCENKAINIGLNSSSHLPLKVEVKKRVKLIADTLL